MPWNDLTDAQKAFLSKYLVSGVMDFFTDQHARPENVETTANFEDFNRLDQLFDPAAAGIPDDYLEKTLILQTAANARALRDAGRFEEASKTIAPALQEIEKTRHILQAQADAVRNDGVLVLPTDGVTAEEANRMDTLRQRIDGHLAPLLPSKAAVDAARNDIAALKTEIDEVTAAVAERDQALEDLESAVMAIAPRLRQIADLDLEPLALAPNFDVVLAAVERATALWDAMGDAKSSSDTEVHKAVTQHLIEWEPEADRAQEEYDKAVASEQQRKEKQEAWDVFQATYQKVAAALQLATRIDLNRHQRYPGFSALKAAVEKAVAVWQEYVTASNSPDMQAYLNATVSLKAWESEANVPEAELAKANAFEQDRISSWAALDRVVAPLWGKIEHAASINTAALKMAPNHGDLVLAVDKAKALMDELNRAKNAWDPELNKAALKLAEAWQPEADTAEAERAKAQAAVAALSEKRVTEKLAEFKLPVGSAAEAAAKRALEWAEGGLHAEPVTEQSAADAKAATRSASDKLGALFSRQPPPSSDELYQARQAYFAAKQKSNATATFQSLTKNLAPGGALTATGKMQLDDATQAKFIDGIGRAPALADEALAACSTSKHVAAVADKIGVFADLVERGASGTGGIRYSDPGFAEFHATHLLKQGAFRGKQYLDGAVAYMDNRWPLTNPEMVSGRIPFTQIATKRGAAVAGAILKTGDPYDLDNPAVAGVMNDLNYGYSAVMDATPIHTLQVEKTIETLKTPEAKEMVKSAKLPTGNGAALAVKLMKQINGDAWIPPDPLTPEITKQALLIAMFNPIEQGTVGSCFATAGVITMREQQALKMMEIYKQALEEGTFTPLKQKGDILDPLPIPLVVEFTPGDNPITRSIEYSAATAGAALANSSNARARDTSIGNALDDTTVIDALQDVTGDSLFWPFDALALRTALSDEIKFIYDPTAEQAEKSADGSSNRGCFVAVVGGTVVHDKDFETGRTKFIDAAFAVAKKAWADKMGNPDTEAKLKAALSDPAFTNAFKTDKFAIWQRPPGGFPQEVDKVLINADSENRMLVPKEADPASKTEGDRTLDVVTGVMASFQGKTGNVSLFTWGQHIFNGQSEHKSQDAIRGKSKPEIAVVLNAMGDQVKSLELPKEQAAKIYDDALADALESVPAALKDAAKAQLDTKRPGAAMKSPDIDAAITQGKDAMWTAVTAALADEHVDPWVLTQGTKLDGKSASDKKAAYAEELKKKPSRDAVRATMAAAMPMPEPIVIADTNWGGGSRHQSFVIAPDPATGEPIMWTVTDPPGSMIPSGRDWVDRNWTVTGP